jgi:pullulanase/glycogen debranching enzyme
MHLIGGPDDDDLALLANMEDESVDFEIPRASGAKNWRRFVDTALGPEEDVREEDAMRALDEPSRYRLAPRSVAVLVAR